MSETAKRADMIVEDVLQAFQALHVEGQDLKTFKQRVAAAVGYHLNEIAHDVEIAIKDIKA